MNNRSTKALFASVATALLPTLVFSGCTPNNTNNTSADTSKGVSVGAPAQPTNVHTYAGDSTATFMFSDPAYSWEEVTPEIREAMKQTALEKNQILIIWGDHVEWTEGHPIEIPEEQKKWVENMVRSYGATNTPVVFVGGLGAEGLFVETQNVDAPAGEESVTKIFYSQ